MLTGRAARRTTWRILDDFLAQHSTDAARPEALAKKTAKKTARKPTARPATGAAEPPVIGANPDRKFSSASSRSLSARPKKKAAPGATDRDAG
jgi:polyhydroxyalkanoate synthase